MTDLTSRTALVTGSARGIGKAIALRYASLGANIAVNFWGDEAGAKATVAEIQEYGVRAIAIKADVSKTDELERLFSETAAQLGQPDIVVANAGLEIINQPVLEATENLYGASKMAARYVVSVLALEVGHRGS